MTSTVVFLSPDQQAPGDPVLPWNSDVLNTALRRQTVEAHLQS